MAALDRIRLTGLLRKDPATAGSFYCRGGEGGAGGAVRGGDGRAGGGRGAVAEWPQGAAVPWPPSRVVTAEALAEFGQRRLGQRLLDRRKQLLLLMLDVIGQPAAELVEQLR